MLQKVVQDSTQAAVFMAFSQISAFKELLLDQSLLFETQPKILLFSLPAPNWRTVYMMNMQGPDRLTGSVSLKNWFRKSNIKKYSHHPIRTSGIMYTVTKVIVIKIVPHGFVSSSLIWLQLNWLFVKDLTPKFSFEKNEKIKRTVWNLMQISEK